MLGLFICESCGVLVTPLICHEGCGTTTHCLTAGVCCRSHGCSSATVMTFSIFFPLLGQFLRILSPRIATMGFTSPCCWPGWDFFCRTTALSPMWTTCTTNTQVGLQQLQHLPATPNLGRPWPRFQGSQSPITCLSAGTSIVFDMSLTYILVALVAVILNNALVELLSLHTRISVGEWGSPRPLTVLAPH